MIYFIQSGDSGPIKIGFASKSADIRKSQLQTGNPNPLRVLAIINGNYTTEKELHKKFDQFRIDNEWFFPSRQLIDFIKLKRGDPSERTGVNYQCDLFDYAKTSVGDSGKAMALYHVVYPDESFDASARILFDLVKYSQSKWPNKKRILFLDIDGHRNEQGGFDRDMLELQKEFLIDFLMKYLYEAHCPLHICRNPRDQDNDLEDAELEIVESKSRLVME